MTKRPKYIENAERQDAAVEARSIRRTFDDFIRHCAEDCVNSSDTLTESELAELRKPLGEKQAEAEGLRPRRVVIDACHYRSLRHHIREVLAYRRGEPVSDHFQLASKGIALASYLSSSFDLDIFGEDLPTLDKYLCIECGRPSDSRLCTACYVENKT